MEIVRATLVSMIEQSRRAEPAEVCGLLLGDNRRVERAQPARNIHPAPQTHFEIDPQALIEAHRAARGGGPQVLGYYHSHPSGRPEPSATDRAQAAGDGKIWAIAADGQVHFWRDEPGGFKPLSYTLVEA